MLNRDDFKIILTSWKDQYGQEYRGRTGIVHMVVPGGRNARREMLSILVSTLISEHQYTKEELLLRSTQDMIEESCVWEDWENKSQLKRWKKDVNEDYWIVVAKFFPVKFIKTEIVEDTSNRHVPSENKKVEYIPKEYAAEECEPTLSPEDPTETGRKEIDFSLIPKIQRSFKMKTPEEIEAEFDQLVKAAEENDNE